MEKMSDKELKMLHNLQAKQKRISRADAKFWAEVSERKEEVLVRLTSENWNTAAQLYGCTLDELYQWVTSQRQIDYYHVTHKD